MGQEEESSTGGGSSVLLSLASFSATLEPRLPFRSGRVEASVAFRGGFVPFVVATGAASRAGEVSALGLTAFLVSSPTTGADSPLVMTSAAAVVGLALAKCASFR